MTVAGLLSIRDLVVEFRTRDGMVRAVDGVDLDVEPGEALAVVGDSGSGKTVTMLAALGLLQPPPRCTVRGKVWFDGLDMLALDRKQLRQLLGRQIGVVFQDPMTSLHPSLRVVDQVAEALLVHNKVMAASEARDRAINLLAQVGIPRPDRRVNDYPHQWSGGMRQRAIVAMAIANQPQLLIADEPTTALDVTIQAQILDLLRQARDQIGAATIFITHDLGVVAQLADRVSVMAAGRVVESGDVGDVFASPTHEQTVRLLAALPSLDRPAVRTTHAADITPGLLRLENVVTHYRRSRHSVVRAVDGVSLDLSAGETLGLVGESGCGKSTLAKTALRLIDATSGRVLFRGEDITTADRRALRPVRQALSMVFQDPYASLNPRMTVVQILAEPLRVHDGYASDGYGRRVGELLQMVGLPEHLAFRRPAALSGGERQRVAIARALALSPRVLVLDEPVSSLDASIRGHIIALLNRLQRELGLAYLFITHDLALAGQICDRVAVMYLGKIVEIGSVADIYLRPTHPYTRALLSAIPVPDPARGRPDGRIVLSGEVPDPAAPPSGCRFRTRCWNATQNCALEEPALIQRSQGSGHLTACIRPEPCDGADRRRAAAAERT